MARILASRETPWFTVELCEDGILIFRPFTGLVLTHEVALQVLAVGLEIVDGPKSTLVLMQDVARVDREAREFFASEDYLTLACQTALVVGSPVTRVIGNFFVGLNKLKYPCKVFDDPERALQWLRGFNP